MLSGCSSGLGRVLGVGVGCVCLIYFSTYSLQGLSGVGVCWAWACVVLFNLFLKIFYSRTQRHGRVLGGCLACVGRGLCLFILFLNIFPSNRVGEL